MSSQITPNIALHITAATTFVYATTVLCISLYNGHTSTRSPIQSLQNKVDVAFPTLVARVTVKRIITTRTEYWVAEMRDGESGVLERSPMCMSEGQAVGELGRLIGIGREEVGWRDWMSGRAGCAVE